MQFAPLDFSRIVLRLVICAIVLALPVTQHSASAHDLEKVILSDIDRLKALLEDSKTIQKAIIQINELTNQRDAQARNQLIRWINTKETHAQRIVETISLFFVIKRINPNQPDYAQRLASHHNVVLLADSIKEQTNPQNAKALIAALQNLQQYYHGGHHHH